VLDLAAEGNGRNRGLTILLKKILMAAALVAALGVVPARGNVTLLNASYDPTRELYQEFNVAFAKHWAK
jgi:sulfate transport system substrate-binding protein